MSWSPNNMGSDVGMLAPWWPRPETVDIVGIDIYPSDATVGSFENAYGGF